MTELTQQEAQAELASKLKQAEVLIDECEVLAQTYNLSFSLNIAYGMGGTFGPAYQYNDETDEETETWDSSDAGWRASSQGC